MTDVNNPLHNPDTENADNNVVNVQSTVSESSLEAPLSHAASTQTAEPAADFSANTASTPVETPAVAPQEENISPILPQTQAATLQTPPVTVSPQNFSAGQAPQAVPPQHNTPPVGNALPYAPQQTAAPQTQAPPYAHPQTGAYHGGQGMPPHAAAVSPSPTGSAVPQTTAQAHPTAAAAKPATHRISPLAIIALLLACALFGFGGSFIYDKAFNSSNTAVVYKSADPSPTVTDVEVPFSVSDIAAKSGESVVSIMTENVVTDRYFGSQVVSGAGSGVIISEDGYIITNNHVVEGASSYVVTLPDGTEVDATLVGADPSSDIAVLKINAKGLVPAVMADIDTVQVGDFCLAIGNPMGSLGGTVTDGIISALDRDLNINGSNMTLLQMSAAVSPGNSGGGLFNASGELVGVVNAKSSGSNTEGLGFAIPVDTALEVARQLIENGYVSGRPSLGIAARQVQVQGTEQQSAVIIEEVTPGSAADLAGIKSGDIFLTFNGTPITTLDELTVALSGHSAGDTVTIAVLRDNEPTSFEVTLQESVPQTTPVGA